MSAPPLSRPLRLADEPLGGGDVAVTAGEAERAALARDFGLVAIRSLDARLHVAPTADGVAVTGRVEAHVVYTCVVDLEPFEAEVSEAVSVRFSDARRPADPLEIDLDADGEDPPEPVIDGRVDLGVVVAEFIALGLDPHPRRPGAVFAPPRDGEGERGPFAALKRLKPEG